MASNLRIRLSSRAMCFLSFFVSSMSRSSFRSGRSLNVSALKGFSFGFCSFRNWIIFRRRAGPPLRLCFLQRWGAEDSCSAGLPSHLRRFPLKYKTWLAPAESINPKRDRLVESHLSKNEKVGHPPISFKARQSWRFTSDDMEQSPH